MKPLTTVAVYGLVPVPPLPDTQACSDNDNQPLTAGDAVAAPTRPPYRTDARATGGGAGRRGPIVYHKRVTCLPGCGPGRKSVV